MFLLQDLAVKIRWAAHKNVPSDWTDIRHQKNVHTLYWVRAGKGRFQSTKGSHEAQSGQLFYLEPSLSMNMAALGSQELKMMMILFDCTRLSGDIGRWLSPSPVPQLGLPHHSTFVHEHAALLDTTLGRIVDLWTPGTAVREMEAHAALLGLIARLHDDLAPDRDRARTLFEQGVERIGQRFAESLTAEQLAAELHVSVSYLRKLFLRYAGETPKQFLSRLRLRHAERYLLHTDMTLHEIAQACGYSDEFHFSRSFKQSRGMPPSTFRRQRGNGS
ncbi:hypothetical protein B9G55_06255 [Saccharibacillus sp. O16]|nr:hypothetical protein B9G55_06255 [Saccharibacillus sp. O16]